MPTSTSPAASPSSSAPPVPVSPFGVAWGFLYGYSGVPTAKFMPRVRELGADFTKIYLFWQQIEPEKGRFDWNAVDAFVEQLRSPAEGLISIFASSRWGTTTPSAMLPPYPAKNLDDYYHFVFETVKHCRGRVRYWQNDAEPNNPIYWAGTKEQFVAQLKVFYRAVKDADPAATVVVGGYDGMFVPPNLAPLPGQRSTPFPQQAAALAFFDHVIQAGAGAFDLFDLRLYGDPYSIVARVDYMRGRMQALGNVRPIICTEYGGPGLFELPENRKYIPFAAAWSQSLAMGAPGGDQTANPIARLYAEMPTLAPQTQMFMQGCSPELEAKYQRLQARGIVMRNLLALAAGVERTLYWELIPVVMARDDLMSLMYGKIGLLGSEQGELKQRTLSADAFARMTRMLAGVCAVKQLIVPEHPSIYLFRVDRGSSGPTFVVWERRDQFSGEDAPPVTGEWPSGLKSPQAIDTFGTNVPIRVSGGKISVSVGITPTYISAAN